MITATLITDGSFFYKRREIVFLILKVQKIKLWGIIFIAELKTVKNDFMNCERCFRNGDNEFGFEV